MRHREYIGQKMADPLAMPVLPRPQRLSLHDAVNYVAERCRCETQKAGKAVLAGLSEGALVASANVLVSDRSYMPSIVNALPDGPPRRVDAGIQSAPSNLWAEYRWPDFLRRAVLPRGNPMYRERTADGGQVGPVYSHPTIATADIDAWLDHDDHSHEVATGAAGEEKEMTLTNYKDERGRDLTPQGILAEIERYEARVSGILLRFRDYNIAEPDADMYSQLIIEIADLLIDALSPNPCSKNIMAHYNFGVQNYAGCPSKKSVTEILGVIRAADFGGISQKRFKYNVSELEGEIIASASRRYNSNTFSPGICSTNNSLNAQSKASTTLPSELRDIAYQNKRVVYDLLMKAAAE
jgi:hypothetical protein